MYLCQIMPAIYLTDSSWPQVEGGHSSQRLPVIPQHAPQHAVISAENYPSNKQLANLNLVQKKV